MKLTLEQVAELFSGPVVCYGVTLPAGADPAFVILRIGRTLGEGPYRIVHSPAGDGGTRVVVVAEVDCLQVLHTVNGRLSFLIDYPDAATWGENPAGIALQDHYNEAIQ